MPLPNTSALTYQLSNDYGTEDHEYLLEAVLCFFFIIFPSSLLLFVLMSFFFSNRRFVGSRAHWQCDAVKQKKKIWNTC